MGSKVWDVHESGPLAKAVDALGPPKAPRVVPKDPDNADDAKAAELAQRLLDYEWERAWPKIKREVTPLLMRSVLYGVPVSDAEWKAAAERVVSEPQ